VFPRLARLCCRGKIIRLHPSNHKFQFLPVRNQAALEGVARKTADGFASASFDAWMKVK